MRDLIGNPIKLALLCLVVGIVFGSAITTLLLPLSQEKIVLDGRSLKAILRGHNLVANAHRFGVDGSKVLEPVQFLENYDVTLIEEGDTYRIRYSPRDIRVRDGAYLVTVKVVDGEYRLEDFSAEP